MKTFASIACNNLTVPLLANLTKLRATKGYQVMLKATGPAVCPYNAWAEIKDVTFDNGLIEMIVIQGSAYPPVQMDIPPTPRTGACRVVLPLSEAGYYEIEVGAEDGTIPTWVLDKAEVITVGGKVVK